MTALKLRLLAVASVLTLACGSAAAQAIDDAWVIERVLAGRFDELKVMEAESEKGSPVAMYWWGAFLRNCVFGRCDEKAAKTLWANAAQAGHLRARLAVMSGVRSLEEFDRTIERIGAPIDWEERVISARVLIALQFPERGARYTWGPAKRILEETIASEPRLGAIAVLSILGGPTSAPDEFRALMVADHPPAAEFFLIGLLISEKARFPQLLAKAKGGDLPVGVALCETVNFREGIERLPADLLSVCERTLAQGYVGVSSTLLRHHRVSGNARAAAFYAKVCASLFVACSSELADYYYDASGRSAAWKLWDAVGGFALRAPTEDDLRKFGLSTETMQQVFAMRLRDSIADRACLSRLYDRGAKKFADDPDCPYLKPVAIPAEFLGGTK